MEPPSVAASPFDATSAQLPPFVTSPKLAGHAAEFVVVQGMPVCGFTFQVPAAQVARVSQERDGSVPYSHARP